jgi:transposase
MPPMEYFNMIQAQDEGFRFGVRKRMVMDALAEGNKPAARLHQTTVKTVRLWVRRYQAAGLPGLKERSRAPKTIPHKTTPEVEQKVIAQKKVLKGFGVGRMVTEFELGCGKGAALRICREAGLLKRRKKKRARRNDLREIKAKWRMGEVACVDTKDLSDIPAYWTQMKQLGLPAWQYTYREVRTGLMFLGYAQDRSLQHATVFAEWITAWLSEHGVGQAGDRWQTDGGGEFIGSWNTKTKSDFIQTLEDRKIAHFQIPKTTYNADVETVHNTIELEFYDIETFRDRKDFFAKASTYQRWYNLIRKNGWRKQRSPLDIIREAAPHIAPAVATLPALDLDDLVKRKIDHLLKSAAPPPGGYHVPGRAHRDAAAA